MSTDFTSKNIDQFICETCDFKCCKKGDYNRHLSTLKHKNLNNPNQNTSKYIDFESYECACGKLYKHQSTLCAHKKKCLVTNEQTDINSIDTNLVIQLLKQNDEFKSLILEQNTKLIEAYTNNNNNVNNNNVNINSNNKAFNLNVFLNEECKDAMSITDFVNSIKLQLSDLEAVGKLGFVNGISNIIIKNLKALDVHMRPIHCTDTKRETMYVKGQDAWEKEGDDNKQLRLAIKRVAKNNFCCLELFKEKHPDCINWDSKHGDHYLKLRIEALGGRGNEDRDNENKIIRRIARETTIDKNY